MFLFVVLAVTGVAVARPEAPVGYNYQGPAAIQAPSSSYGAPSRLTAGGHSAGSFGSGGFTSGAQSGSFHSGVSGFGAGGQSGGSNGGFALGGQGGAFTSGGFGGNGGFGGSGFSDGTIVQKHIYVHVPPPEPFEQRPQRIISAGQPQKHYKIIFIKAPAQQVQSAPLIQPVAQNEEKTLVYVLVKKPEEQPDIVIPTSAPTQPSKPEVYFIKYQTQKDGSSAGGSGVDAGFAAAGIGSGHSSGSGSTDGGHGGVELADFTSGGDDITSGHGASGSGASAPQTQYGPPH